MPSSTSPKHVASNPGRLSRRATLSSEQPISYLMHQALLNPELISLAAGFADPETLPIDATLQCVTELLEDPATARHALQYGTTQGLSRLREAAVEHLAELEGRRALPLALDPNQVVITNGSQQFLQLVGDVLIDPGDIVLVGAPDYFVYMGTLAGLGARVIGVAMDGQGLIPEALKEALSRIDRAGALHRVKLVYCTSYYQNPTGVTLAADRRPEILEIVRRWSTSGQIYVLEDAAYRELYYDQPAPPSIRSYDAAGATVILAQTFSKTFSPGLKIGYGFLPDSLRAPVLHMKGNHDFGSSSFTQHLLAIAVTTGRYAEHLERLRGGYRSKLAATLEALDQEFGRRGISARWTRPDGGLYVWVTLPAELDTRRESALFRRALDQGVLYVPGEYCFPDEWDTAQGGALGGPTHTMRLCFATPSQGAIVEAIRRLAAAIEQCGAGAAPAGQG